MISKIKDSYLKNEKYFDVAKITLMSLLMLFSLMVPSLINVLLVFAILCVITASEFNGVYYCFLLANFRFVFRNNLVGGIPYVTVVFCTFALTAIIKYWFIRKEKPKFNWFIIGVSALYLLYLLLPIHKFVFNEYVKFVVMISILNFLVVFKDKIDIKKLILYFATGTIIASFIFVITQVWFRSSFIEMAESVVTSFGALRYRGLAGDPNYYTLDVVIAMAGLYFLYFKREIKWFIFTPLVMTLSIFIWLTYSKSMVVGLAVLSGLVIVFSCVKDFKKNWYKPLIFIALILMGVILTHYVMDLFTLGIFDRFKDNYVNTSVNEGAIILEQLPAVESPTEVEVVMDNVLTGRWSLWRNHLIYVFSSVKNFLFGGGIGTFVEPMEAHNTPIQILYETGFIGTVIFVALFIFIFKEFGFNKNLFKLSNWINWLVILICAVMFCNVNYLASTSFTYHVSIFIFTLFAFNNKNIKERKEDVNNIHSDIQSRDNSTEVIQEPVGANK